MDEIYYLVKRVQYALLGHQSILNNERLFNEHSIMWWSKQRIECCLWEVWKRRISKRWQVKINFDTFYCCLFADIIGILIIFSAYSFDEDYTLSVGWAIQYALMKRKLEHEYAVTGWALSVLCEIWCHLACDLTGEHHLMIEKVIEWLHYPPCLNNLVSACNMAKIIYIIWGDLKNGRIWPFPMPFIKEHFSRLMP